jgi:hypothetical protein
VYLSDALEFTFSKLQFLRCTFDIGSRGGYLFAARTTYQFIEAGLLLGETGLCFSQACCSSRAVLPNQYLPGGDFLSFGYSYFDDRFTNLRG